MATPEPHSESSLESLPVEVIEQILTGLSLDDIRNVRLVSREMKAKASGGCFKTFCFTKEVDLRTQSLREVSALMEPGSVACELRHLTITGVLYVTMTQEKIIRLKTKPADPADIFNNKRDFIGNTMMQRPGRVLASAEDLAHAEAELNVLERWQSEAAIERCSAHDVEALTELFVRIRKYATLRRLQSLTLKVTVVRFTKQRLAPEDGGAWRQIWDTAAHTFLATLQALASAHLVIECLDAYSGLRVCSLPGFDIADTLEHIAQGKMWWCFCCVAQHGSSKAFADVHDVDEHASTALDGVLNSLKSFSLSTSARALPATGSQRVFQADPDSEVRDTDEFSRMRSAINRTEDAVSTGDLSAMSADPRNTTGVASFLQKMPELEELTLHEYTIPWHNRRNSVEKKQSFFHSIAFASPLRCLKRLTFRGLSPNAAELLSFFHANHDLESVDFRDIVLHGPWQPIFTHLSSSANKFTHLHFDVVFEQLADNLTYLYFPGASIRAGIRSVPAPDGAAAVSIEGRAAVLAGIQYTFSRQWVMGCVQHSAWREERSREYGPSMR
ncbi:hypothetical protein LTR08_008040 [Meristemomyces frigidus]|nr:hypothetical protein LTR08_008040 [Meristemomyces frigidus]